MFEANGEVVADVFQPTPGERVRQEIDMRFDGQTWKAADVVNVTLEDCQQAPTAAGLKIIE